MKRLFVIFCAIVFTIYWLRFRKPKTLVIPPEIQYISSKQLKLQLGIIQRCGYGEFDAMEMDTVLKPSSRVLMTIEDKSSIPYLKETISLEQLSRGELKFSIPPIAGNTLVEIFLCLDSEGRSKCGPKEKISLPESRSRLLKGLKLNAKTLDPIYYHKLLVYTNEGVLYLPRNAVYDTQQSTKAFKFLTALGPAFDNTQKWSQILFESAQKSALFPSVDLETKENLISAKVVKYHPAACGKN